MKLPYLKLYTLIIILAVIIIPYSCKKTVEDTSVPPATTSISGLVTDIDKTPVSNATVAGGTATTTTDANGKFTLTKVEFTANSVLVNVTKEGFFQGSKNFVSTTGTINNATIRLIPKPAAATITASSGGNVTVPGGGSVIFPGGFVNASTGSAYTGNVSVSTIYLNSTDQNFSANVPGNLKGVSASNQQGVLQSFGVVVVEMNDASGNKLQLAPGKTATITLPIPPALQGNAPASIPVWYFDDKKGVWTHEATATKQGNNYVGAVKHFSFWTPGDISGSVNLSATFIDSNGVTFANKLVSITRPDSSMASSYTDSTGTVSGAVPVNEVLIMKVYDDCREVYQTTFGPLSEDTAFGKISIVNYCHQSSADSTQYIKLTLNGANYSWDYSTIRESKYDTSGLFDITMTGGSWVMSVYDTTTFFEGQILYSDAISSPQPGDYNFSIQADIGGGATGNFQAYFSNALISNVTKFDEIGGYIEGDASGWIKNSLNTNDSIPFSCSYRIRRTQ